MIRPDRRTLMAAGLSLAATPAAAAPAAANLVAWTHYEARLQTRLEDAAGGRFDEAAARQVLVLTNAARAAHGAGPLDWRDDLALTAQAQAADMAGRGYFDHLSPEGFDPSHRFWLLARRTIGSPSENLAFHRGPTPQSAAGFMRVWKASPPHWRNLLRPSHIQAGFGVVRRGDRAWLCGLYARPLAELAEPLPFRPERSDLARAFRSLPPELRTRVETPQGSPLGLVQGAPQVMQIAAARPVEGAGYEIIGGPIFVMPG